MKFEIIGEIIAMNIIEQFIRATAWEMVRPASYGPFHLIFFFAGLAFAFLFAWLFRKSSEKTNKIIMLSMSLFLIITEVYKNLFYYWVIGDGAYQWWIFPFQLCSVPMYLGLISPLCKGKVQQAMYDFLLAFNLMSGFISFLEPSGLTHEYWTLTLHAFIWHMMLVVMGLYLGFSGRAGRKLSDYKGAAIVFLVTCAIATVINVVTYLCGIKDVNMFYISPFDNSPIIVFKDINRICGWYVNAPLYIGCIMLAAFIFFLPFCIWHKKHDEAKDKIEEV